MSVFAICLFFLLAGFGNAYKYRHAGDVLSRPARAVVLVLRAAIRYAVLRSGHRQMVGHPPARIPFEAQWSVTLRYLRRASRPKLQAARVRGSAQLWQLYRTSELDDQ